MLHLNTENLLFLAFLFCFVFDLPQTPIATKNTWYALFPVTLEAYAFKCLTKDPCYSQNVYFPAIWSVSSSLFISSYYPVLTI